ncbi:TOX high mobility group box family member 3-like isoform X1 [Saccoglossus kowalevskii]|uniref:TOX high mobility group box family member 3-like isoform X2 n=1 Tax=Saccoglossus kowalevskii TaxID=10224 RepID=A0ABM0MMD9_SACKO|nr:PREDICTED: TOX high mobility group box family member 3-like isoform X2 [Saccoglossus kowalevskii]
METTFCLGNEFELPNMFDQYLFKGEDNSTFGLSMSNVQQNNTITPNPVMQHETFHTPSLGDEEFDIPPITPPQIAMEAMSTSMTDPNTAPALTEPMTSPSPTFTHDSNPKFTQAHITETADSLPNPAMETFPDPQFPPQTIDIPPITASNCSLGIDTVPCAVQSTGEQSYSHTLPMTTFAMTTHPTPSYIHDVHIPPPPQHVQSQVSQLSTINQSAISSHLGLQVGMRHGIHMVDGRLSKHSPSPPTTSPIPHESSEDSDDNTPLSQVVGTLKRTAVEVTPPPPKKKTPKKKKKKDPNEPQKPVSAYALFFRDTQAAIKGQNPNASFGEVSKIVASMWDSLGVEQKQVYKQNTEAAKKEYLKKLAAYRASLVSKAAVDQAETEDVSSHKQKKMTVTSNTLTSANTTTTMIQSIPRIIAPKPTPTASMPITVTMTTVARSASQQPVVQTIITNPKLQPHMVHTNERKRSATCMRVGCENPAVESPDWDKEYCSNECVVSHCRDVFTAWVASRNPNIFPSVK